jgi:hypothetical protein
MEKNYLRDKLIISSDKDIDKQDVPTQIDFEYLPETDEEFYSFIESAPLDILNSFGFKLWGTVNDIILENKLQWKPNVPKILQEVDEDIVLFPKQWYTIIPKGYTATGLFAEDVEFKHGKTDKESMFGCLHYGFKRSFDLG